MTVAYSRVRRGKTLAVVLAGAFLLFALGQLPSLGLQGRLVLGTLPVAMVALVSRSLHDTVLWAAYMAAILLFASVRAEADSFGFAVQAEYVIRLERALFRGTIPTVWLQDRFYSVAAIDWVDGLLVLVHLSYFIVPHLIAFFLWAYRPERFPGYLIAVVVTYYLGLMVYILVPTVPPWLAAAEVVIAPVNRVVHDIMFGLSHDMYQYGNAIVGENDVAAMPSLHGAITVLAALALAGLGRAGALLGWAYAVIMGVALVYLGEHYVVDVIAGATLGIIVWIVVHRGGPRHILSPRAPAGGSREPPPWPAQPDAAVPASS